MSQAEELIQSEVVAFPVADAGGAFSSDVGESIYSSAANGWSATVQVIEQADGWRAGIVATLPDGGYDKPPRAFDWPLPSREAAIASACEVLIAWLSDEKLRGGKRHKKQAGEMQDWALRLEKREQATDVQLDDHKGNEAGQQADAVSIVEAEASAATPETSGSVGRVLALQTSTVSAGELPIEELYESPLNPRQYYPKAKMDELTESMRVNGFRPWQHLVVKPRDEGGYWIAAGHRRKRAAEKAGITQIPCMIRQMTDVEFRDVLNFDNSNREDVHPLHEAAGWRALIRDTGIGVADIAKRIGRSPEYVYGRLKCMDLIDRGQELFLDERIKEGHAVQIARLPERYQIAALDFCCPGFDPDRHVTVRQLSDWIQSNCFLSLLSCGFDPASEDLLPITGSCTTCPKRSGASPELFSDLGNPDICTDPRCYVSKQAAAEALRPKPVVAAAPPPPPPPAPTPAPPIPKLKPAPVAPPLDTWAKDRDAEEERIRAEGERAEKIYLKAMDAILEKVAWPLSQEDFAAVLAFLVGAFECNNDLADKFAIVKKTQARWMDIVTAIPRLSPAKLVRMAIAGILLDSASQEGYSHSNVLADFARRYRVDLKAIGARVDEDISGRADLRKLNPPPNVDLRKVDLRKEAIGKLPSVGEKRSGLKPAVKTPTRPAAPPQKRAAKPVPKKAATTKKPAGKPTKKGKKK